MKLCTLTIYLLAQRCTSPDTVHSIASQLFMRASSQIPFFLKKLKTNSQAISGIQSYLEGISQLPPSTYVLFYYELQVTGHQASKILMQVCGKFPEHIEEIYEGRKVPFPSRGTDVRDSEEGPAGNTFETHRVLLQADRASV